MVSFIAVKAGFEQLFDHAYTDVCMYVVIKFFITASP